MAKEQTIRLYQDIKKEYKRLNDIKEFGVKKYSDQWIYNYLAAKFYKSSKTVENIIFGRVALSENT